MRRALAQRSWLDTITSSWVNQSFSIKGAVLIGVSLASFLLGLWVGSAVLLTTLVLSVTLCIHSLFVAHEHQRLNGAKIMAQESINLKGKLLESQNVLDKANEAVDEVVKELNQHCEAIKKDEAAVVSEVVEKMKKETEELQEQRKEIGEANDSLMIEEKKFQEELHTVNDKLEALKEEVSGAVTHVKGISETAHQLHDTVSALQVTQKAYAEKYEGLGFFSSEKETNKSPETSSDTDLDWILKELGEMNSIMDTLIASTSTPASVI